MMKKMLKNYFSEIFSLDLRSLALFRILLAGIIICNLFSRSFDIIAHYSDDGILPRVAAIANNGPFRWSFHLMSGLWQVQLFLFILAGIFALLLLLGYKTRIVTIISWIFLISLTNRNIWINSAADQLLNLITFWSIFLPLGAKYSIDSLKYNSKLLPIKVTSVGSFGYTMQIFFMYFFTAIFKFDPGWTTQGTAVYYVLHLYAFVTPFGQFLNKYFAWSFKYITHAVYIIEALGFYFLFSPFKTGFVRTIAIFIFMCMHIGFGLGLYLGIFSYVVVIAFTALLPSFFWENLQRITHYNKQQKLIIYYDNACGFCEQIVNFLKIFLLLSNTKLIPAHKNKSLEKEMNKFNSWIVINEKGEKFYKFDTIIPLSKTSPILYFFFPVLCSSFVRAIGKPLYNYIASRRGEICPIHKEERYFSIPKALHLSKFESIFLCISLIYIFYYNVFTLSPTKIPKIPLVINQLGFFFALQQQWNMFSPHPPENNGWFVIPGKLVNGNYVDLFYYGHPVSWDPPLGTSRQIENVHWSKYFSNLSSNKKFDYSNYAKYLCRKWNNSHKGKEQLEKMSMYFMYQKIGLNEKQEKINKFHVLDWYCIAVPKDKKVKK